MSFCPKCGSELPDDSGICAQCGQVLAGDDNPYAANLTEDNGAYDIDAGSTSMSFIQAVSTCFRKYASFSGRARRKEYWYFVLFQILAWYILIPLVILLPVRFLCNCFNFDFPIVGRITFGLAHLALAIPHLAVAVRRLHDRGSSGWFLLAPPAVYSVGLVLILAGGREKASIFVGFAGGLLGFIGFIMGIFLLVALARIGETGANKYGSDPLRESSDNQ